ncbi:MAG: cyclic nucleotide-binding domain-containing protein [Thermoanaerobaculales bacterium]
MFRLFQHCDIAQLTRLASFARDEQVSEGQTLFQAGDPDCDFFVVVAGSVETLGTTPAGEQRVARVHLGQLFGEVSFLDKLPRPVLARATQPSALLRFNGRALQATLEEDLELAVGLGRAFWQSLAAKIRQANQCLLEEAGAGAAVGPVANGGRGESVDLKPRAKLALFHERGLAAAELRLLATTLPAEHYPADGVLFAEGDVGQALYIVAEGDVRIVRHTSDGGEEELARLGRGEILGELALVDDEPRSADARAGAQGCTILVLTRQDLDDVLTLPAAAASQFLQHICGLLCARLRTVIESLATRATPVR